MQAGRYVYLAPLKFYMGQAQTLEGHTDFVEDLAVSPDGPAGCFGVARSDFARLGSGGRSHGRDFHGSYGVVRWHPTASPRSPAT
jgi:hypothetical protein